MQAAYKVDPRDIQLSTVSPQGGALNVVFRTDREETEAHARVVRDIRKNVHPPEGLRATPSGLAVVGVGLLGASAEANRVILTYVAIGFVFLFLWARLRSVVRSLLSLVPVLI